VRVELEIAHEVGEGIPFRLRKCHEQMLVRDDGMVSAPRVFYGAFEDPLCRLTDFA
jgi:hypothetical protein